MPLGRFLDDEHSPEVREHVTRLTMARFVGNTGLRFAQPYLGVIGRGLGVSLSTMGIATSFGEFTGLLGPVVGHQLNKRSRRASMTLALVVLALGTALAGTAPTVAAISVGFVVLSLGKMMFDNGMNSWLVERTDYATRGRVVGLTEIAWAGAILIGIPLLAVLVFATSWRYAYGAIALSLLYMAWHLWRYLPKDRPTTHLDGTRRAFVWSVPAAAGFVSFGLVMAIGGCLFVSFGSWLKDVHRFSSLGIGAVSILLGAVELLASTSTVRFTDRWGKRRSIRIGVMVALPAAVGLALASHHVVFGLLFLSLLFLGFEFAIVSFASLLPSLQPNSPSTAFGLAVGVGTVSRGIVAIASTRLYTADGIGGSSLLAAGMAAAALVTLHFVTEPALRSAESA
jgi:predicted MFS family arabinose efflux permease